MITPLFLFAHGAGAPSSHPWMRAWTERLGTSGRVVPFDYPYMRAGRRRAGRERSAYPGGGEGLPDGVL